MKEKQEHECTPTKLGGQPFAMWSHKPDGQDRWIHMCVCAICKRPFTVESDDGILRES